MTVEIMNSAQLARVEEIPQRRRFKVGNDGLPDSVVTFDPERETLFCNAHGTYDNCTCTTRVLLCGILTHTVTENLKVVRPARKEA